MEFRRLRAGLRRICSRGAFTLIETMIAFALIGITALFTASGLIAGLGIYQKANDLRNACSEAVTRLYQASDDHEQVDEYDPDDVQIGVVKRTGEFSPESSQSSVIDVYEVCALKHSAFLENKGIVFYYYDPADAD